MSRFSAFVRIAAVLALALAFRTPAEAASLSGTVRDYGAPNEAQAGLGGVEIVVLGQDGKEIRKGSTNAAGFYKLDNLPSDVPLKVLYSLVSYRDRPTELETQLTGSGAVHDVDLVQESQGQGYFQQVVDNLLVRSKGSSGLEEEWLKVRAFDLPPESYEKVFDLLEQQIGAEKARQLEQTPDKVELMYKERPDVVNRLDAEQLMRKTIDPDAKAKDALDKKHIKTADEPPVFDPAAAPPPGR